MIWKPSKNDIFSSKSCYKVFSNQAVDTPFPFRRIWNPSIPPKVSFFMWNAYLDKILTLNHLQSRRWSSANFCVMCRNEVEAVNHLFVHCPVANRVWGFFLSHLRILWVFPDHFQDLIQVDGSMVLIGYLFSFGRPSREPFVGVFGKK